MFSRNLLAITDAIPAQGVTLAVLIAAENLAHVAIPALVGVAVGILGAVFFHHAIMGFVHDATEDIENHNKHDASSFTI